MAFELLFDGAGTPNVQRVSIPNVLETGTFTLTVHATLTDIDNFTRIFSKTGTFDGYCAFHGAAKQLRVRNNLGTQVTLDYTGLVTNDQPFELVLSRNGSNVLSATIDGSPLVGAPVLTGSMEFDSIVGLDVAGSSTASSMQDFTWVGASTSRTYLMNEGTGLTVADTSGGGDDGTYINPPGADAQWNGLSTAPTIISFNGNNIVKAGEQNVPVVTSNFPTTEPTTWTPTLKDQALIKESWNAGQPIVSIPTDIDSLWETVDNELKITFTV